MSDSDSGLSNPNVFTFQNTTVSARGPNTNITNFNFRSKYVPRNFERQRYAESVSDQRSIYYRRETSPMSIHSACDFRPRNFQPFYNKMSSNQSVFNGRSGSPVSMRSIDSTASVSAADIAFALNNVKFNKYDLKVIKEAYQKAMKQRIRKRIEKRRNMRLFLKGNRHRSGDDSGEQGSDSSISSDDCRSVQTFKENMSCNRSERIDMSQFHKTIRENNMTDNFRQNNFKNMFTMSNSNVSRNHTFNSSTMSKQSYQLPSQKDRFKNGFLLPSQRFNRSVASSVILENAEKQPKNMESSYRQNDKLNSVANRPLHARNCESGSEEEIFSERCYVERNVHNPQRKRFHESDDETSLPDRKKAKISSPVKNLQKNVPSKPNKTNPVNNNCEDSNTFEFVKPALPVRKSRPKVQEKIVAKSKQPLAGFVDHASVKVTNNVEAVEPISKETEPIQEIQNNDKIQNDHLESTQNSDVAMRPSFIKRKLFTQKLDVAEKANLSSDASNSPQSNVYGDLQKEKNKARKLVSSQSCLNRDVQDDSNLLDLIRKIVPPDRMNATNQTTASVSRCNVDNSKKKEDDEDKWDVTSVISMCNDNDVSDTFTDEDIFERDNKKKTVKKNKKDDSCANDDLKQAKPTEKVENNKNQQQIMCRPVVVKLHDIQKSNQKLNVTNNNLNKSTVKSSAKTFWDTDFESDAECQITMKQKSFIKQDQPKSSVVATSSQEFNHPAADKITQNPAQNNRIQAPETSRWLNNTKNINTTMNSTLTSTRKLNITSLGVRSHRTTRKNKCCIETCFQEKTASKPVVIAKNNKNTTNLVDNKNEKTESTKVSNETNKTTKKDTKTETEKKTPAQKSKPKSNAPKDNNAKCTKNTRKSKNNNKSTTKLSDNKNEKTESTNVSIEPNKATKKDTKKETEKNTSAKKSKVKSNSQKENIAKYTTSIRKSPRLISKTDKSISDISPSTPCASLRKKSWFRP